MNNQSIEQLKSPSTDIVVRRRQVLAGAAAGAEDGLHEGLAGITLADLEGNRAILWAEAIQASNIDPSERDERANTLAHAHQTVSMIAIAQSEGLIKTPHEAKTLAEIMVTSRFDTSTALSWLRGTNRDRRGGQLEPLKLAGAISFRAQWADGFLGETPTPSITKIALVASSTGVDLGDIAEGMASQEDTEILSVNVEADTVYIRHSRVTPRGLPFGTLHAFETVQVSLGVAGFPNRISGEPDDWDWPSDPNDPLAEN